MVPSPAIEAVIRRWYERIEAGEMVPAAEEMLASAPGFLAIGTESGEWIDGREALVQAYRQASALGSPRIGELVVRAYEEGTVGWAFDTVVMQRPGRSPLTMRHTFVLHVEEGEWRVVHAHYSFGVSEERLAAIGAPGTAH